MFNIYFKEMKKFFSLIALVGVIAACTPEQVETAFKLAGGKVTVNVEVVDIINGGNYTGAYTVSSNFGTVSGNQIVFQANESEPVAAGDYTVSVSGPELAKTYSSNFTVPAVLAGGEAVVRVIVPVGEPINGWTVDFAFDYDKYTEGEDVYFLANTHYKTHAYSHEGIDTWYYNNSEYILEGTLTYDWVLWLSEVSNLKDNNILGFEGCVQNVADKFESDFVIEDYSYDFKVSAWAMWNVRVINAWYQAPCTVFAFKDANEDEEYNKGEEYVELGGFDCKQTEEVDFWVAELPYPGAPGHAHYHAGHGHDAHGAAANAGGGLALNE